MLVQLLALAGIVLIWVPIVAPFFFSIVFLIRTGEIHFDYLMPAELFIAEAIGGILLLLVSFRKKICNKCMGSGFVVTIASLVIMQKLAVFTGLASGRTKPEGWPMFAVLFFLAIYWIGITGMGIGAVIVFKKLLPRVHHTRKPHS